MRNLIAFVLFLAVGACERKALDQSRGPQTSPTAIKALQDSLIQELDPYLVQEGQKVHFIESQEVISSQGPVKALSKEWLTEVKQVENEPEERILTTYKTVTDKIWDKDFSYIFKGVYSLPQIETLRLLDQLDQDRYNMKSVLLKLQEAGRVEEKDIDGVAFHNLVHEQVSLIPPDLVKNAENCKGIENCRLQGNRISYDVVFHLTDDSTQTHRVEWLISKDVPFFAAILRQCSTSIIPIDDLRVLVKQCNEVVDFDY